MDYDSINLRSIHIQNELTSYTTPIIKNKYVTGVFQDLITFNLQNTTLYSIHSIEMEYGPFFKAT